MMCTEDTQEVTLKTGNVTPPPSQVTHHKHLSFFVLYACMRSFHDLNFQMFPRKTAPLSFTFCYV